VKTWKKVPCSVRLKLLEKKKKEREGKRKGEREEAT